MVIEDNDIFGDAVNVAARLEGWADPGGICVSARVRGDAAGKLEICGFWGDIASCAVMLSIPRHLPR